MNTSEKYKDIINLPPHKSKTRKQMSMIDRAAQFSPFAALTGHEDAINETGRIVYEKTDLDENAKSVLNEKLQIISDYIDSSPVISVTFFKPDSRKKGGAYVTHTGNVLKIDVSRRVVLFSDMYEIIIDDISEIEADILNSFEF